MSPKFEPVDLTEMMESGVLLAANVTFFWPLGLALAWQVDKGVATGLYLSEWTYPDGHHETIALEPNDDILPGRREGFRRWMEARIESLPTDERERAIELMTVLDHPTTLGETP